MRKHSVTLGAAAGVLALGFAPQAAAVGGPMSFEPIARFGVWPTDRRLDPAVHRPRRLHAATGQRRNRSRHLSRC